MHLSKIFQKKNYYNITFKNLRENFTNFQKEEEETEYNDEDIINFNVLIRVKGFLNSNNFCSFDSLLSLFIFSVSFNI